MARHGVLYDLCTGSLRDVGPQSFEIIPVRLHCHDARPGCLAPEIERRCADVRTHIQDCPALPPVAHVVTGGEYLKERRQFAKGVAVNGERAVAEGAGQPAHGPAVSRQGEHLREQAGAAEPRTAQRTCKSRGAVPPGAKGTVESGHGRR